MEEPISDPRHLDKAVERLRQVADPYARVREADRLDASLVAARSAVAQIKRLAVEEMRTPGKGYGSIAARLGLTKARVQQIVSTPPKGLLAAYAFQDEAGEWYGTPGLLPVGRYVDAPMMRAFEPADEFNPLYGQRLLVRYGEVPADVDVSVYAIHLNREDGSPMAIRSTEGVQDELFGPPIVTTKEHKEWQAKREARRRALEATE